MGFGAGGSSDFRANGFAVRHGGGTQLGRGCALKLRVEFFDLGFERGDLVVQSMRARSEIGSTCFAFFFGERHTTNLNAATESRRKFPAHRVRQGSGHVIARPILQSSPKLKLANGETAVQHGFFRIRIFSERIRRRERAISGARNSIPCARFRSSSARV
jgi:hypothetical protein